MNKRPVSVITRTAGVALVATLSLASLAACGNNDSKKKSAPSASSSMQEQIKIEDGWVKSAKSGEMTGVFGDLKNMSDKPVTVMGASSSVSKMVQLHETVTTEGGGSKMQELKGGMKIGPGQTYKLRPGGNHIMFMGLNKPLKAGEKVNVVVKLEGGKSYDIPVTVRDFAGAMENYDPATENPKNPSQAPSKAGDKKGEDHSGHAGH